MYLHFLSIILFQRTVQAWIPEAKFLNQTEVQILHPPLWKLSAKIQLATQMKTQVRLMSIFKSSISKIRKLLRICFILILDPTFK